jgi:hypothetical protein
MRHPRVGGAAVVVDDDQPTARPHARRPPFKHCAGIAHEVECIGEHHTV